MSILNQVQDLSEKLSLKILRDKKKYFDEFKYSKMIYHLKAKGKTSGRTVDVSSNPCVYNQYFSGQASDFLEKNKLHFC